MPQRSPWIKTMDWWPQRGEDIPRSAFKKADRIAKQLIAGCEEWGVDEDSAIFGYPPIKVTVSREPEDLRDPR
jgi:hypothetical protein